MEFDPTNQVSRDDLMSGHPLVKRNYLAVTPSIQWAYERVRNQVWLNMPNIYFQSVPRMGKTHCASAIIDAVRSEFNDRYVLLVTADITGTEGIVLSMAKAMRLVPKVRETQVAIRDRVMTHIVCELASVGGYHFVLIIDEMQCLRSVDYHNLQVLQNRLSVDNINMTTIGFAQTEINSVRSSLLLSQDTAVVGRFLSERVDFVGCNSASWLRETMECFDESLYFPRGSDCSYTLFFLLRHLRLAFVCIIPQIYSMSGPRHVSLHLAGNQFLQPIYSLRLGIC